MLCARGTRPDFERKDEEMPGPVQEEIMLEEAQEIAALVGNVITSVVGAFSEVEIHSLQSEIHETCKNHEVETQATCNQHAAFKDQVDEKTHKHAEYEATNIKTKVEARVEALELKMLTELSDAREHNEATAIKDLVATTTTTTNNNNNLRMEAEQQQQEELDLLHSWMETVLENVVTTHEDSPPIVEQQNHYNLALTRESEPLLQLVSPQSTEEAPSPEPIIIAPPSHTPADYRARVEQRIEEKQEEKMPQQEQQQQQQQQQQEQTTASSSVDVTPAGDEKKPEVAETPAATDEIENECAEEKKDADDVAGAAVVTEAATDVAPELKTLAPGGDYQADPAHPTARGPRKGMTPHKAPHPPVVVSSSRKRVHCEVIFEADRSSSAVPDTIDLTAEVGLVPQQQPLPNNHLNKRSTKRKKTLHQIAPFTNNNNNNNIKSLAPHQESEKKRKHHPQQDMEDHHTESKKKKADAELVPQQQQQQQEEEGESSAINTQSSEDSTAYEKRLAELRQKLSDLDATLKQMKADQEKHDKEVYEHIDRLHRYNDLKDIAQTLMGRLALHHGLCTRDMYARFDLDEED